MASKEEMSKIGKSNVRRGKSLERRVANLFIDWTTVAFRRRRVEGRDSTTIERDSASDVIAVRGDLKFSIEVKCGAMSSIDGLLSDPASNIFTKHWHQASYDAKLVTSIFQREIYPLLFFKPQPAFDWVAVPQSIFAKSVLKPLDGSDRSSIWFPNLAIDIYNYTGPISHNVSHTHNKKNAKIVELQLEPVYICRWRDFIANVNPASLFVGDVLPECSPEPDDDQQQI